jgi:hypothetical protein
MATIGGITSKTRFRCIDCRWLPSPAAPHPSISPDDPHAPAILTPITGPTISSSAANRSFHAQQAPTEPQEHGGLSFQTVDLSGHNSRQHNKPSLRFSCYKARISHKGKPCS